MLLLTHDAPIANCSKEWTDDEAKTKQNINWDQSTRTNDLLALHETKGKEGLD